MSKRKQRYPQLINGNESVPESNRFSLRSRLKPKSLGQEFFISSVNESIITLCEGPAGSGKTYITAGLALQKLLSNEVSQIIITKPIIEAGGESIGFLKGSEEEKIAPHFLNIMDAIDEHIGPAMSKKLVDAGKIKFLPIGFARGRDLKNAFIFVDECQNLTKIGIKLIMTRISEGSMMVLNGDSDQIDIDPRKSGFKWAIDNLSGKHADIRVVTLNKSDVCRHPLISTIVTYLSNTA